MNKRLCCTFCGGNITTTTEYQGRDRGGDVFIGFECFDCSAEWDRSGDVIREGRDAPQES
jgi:hypothetical protein